jgi:DNA-binding SARP family transcriptional activator
MTVSAGRGPITPWKDGLTLYRLRCVCFVLRVGRRMGRLEFRILGPLEARRDNRVVSIPASRERAVLAALLLQANQVASAEWLVERLWGTAPPPTARNTLHSLVHRLRHRLEPLPPLGSPRGRSRLLTTRQLGYSLTIEPGQLDLDDFEELFARARAAMSAGRAEVAATLLREALALWRGPPLNDVSAVGIHQSDVPRLQERFMEAVEARLEADLAAGRHAGIVGELRSLVAEHPLREQLSGQLMVALYLGGRQAEALARYAELREVLIADLGIEPGPQLQRLHRLILTHDPSLHPSLPVDGSASASASAAAAGCRPPGVEVASHRSDVGGPCQLLPDTSDFTGRRAISQRLRGVLTGASTARRGCLAGATIVGMPGVGKTALAVHVAHSVRADLPDGQFFVDLRGMDACPAAPEDVLAQLLRALGVPRDAVPDGTAARATLYRSTLARRRALIVLDNAADEAQVRPLVPPAGCAVLITGRRPLTTLPGLPAIRLDTFTAAEAVTLLRRIVPAARAPDGSADAAELARLCGHLPLALRIAGARLAGRPHWPVRRLADRLASEHRRLDELAIGDLEVRASLEPSYQALPSPVRRAFRVVSSISCPDFAVWFVAAALDRPASEAEDVMERLVDGQLADPAGLDMAGQPRYRLHDLVRVFGRERLEREESAELRTQARRRALACCLALTRYARAQVERGESASSVRAALAAVPAGCRCPQVLRPLAEQPLGWLAAERDTLACALREAAAARTS